MTWKLLVVPVCWKSWMMAAIMIAKISRSVSQLCVQGNQANSEFERFEHFSARVIVSRAVIIITTSTPRVNGLSYVM